MPGFKLRITRSKKRDQSPEAPAEKDRRKNPRIELDAKVHCLVPGHPAKEVIAQNISAGGMCLLLDQKISPRLILELEIELPGSGKELISTYAEVVWQSNSHTGLKFISM